ncbi:MAG: T9SS type A sorting domain-containing protein, partial [Candidatus Latescibacteria bacterium]|nr:T9SS type A sorting domain-containing protein [Candidatus Latescibacterota bacterium]
GDPGSSPDKDGSRTDIGAVAFSPISIIINEVNYNSSSDINPEDWVELFNNSDKTQDLSGWIFKDEDDAHEFVLPEGTIISQGGYLVMCRDTTLFKEVFPAVENYVGNLSFGLSSRGELIRIYNNKDTLVNYLTYDNNPPWPEEPDGNGPTLALRDPSFDNIIPANWAASVMYGTPGEINVYITSVNETVIPAELTLGQNYPNPFNPLTTIPFYIPEAGRVTIDVYSVLGQHVASLLDEYSFPGHNTVVFNAEGFAAGLYFYSIKADEFIKTKQMMLIK